MNTDFRRRWKLATVIGDAVLILVGFALAYWLRYHVQWIEPVDEENFVEFSAYYGSALLLMVILLLAYKIEGLYDQRRTASWLDSVYLIFSGTVVGVAALIVWYFSSRPLAVSRLMLLYTAVIVVVLVSLSRLVAGAIRRSLHRRGIATDRLLIVGAGEVGRAIMGNIVAQPELGYQVIGYVDDDPEKAGGSIGRFPSLGTIADTPGVLREYRIDDVIITLPWYARDSISRVLEACEHLSVRTRIVPDMFQMRLNQLHIETINGIPLIGVRDTNIRGWNRAVKRGLDVTLASLAVLVTSPIMALIAAAIKLDSPGPVLYRQTRVGMNGREFTVYKFRSMRIDADQELARLLAHNEASGPLFKMRDDPRRTRVGRFIRRTSLDELPQFFNVLLGDMSLVGPRPPVPDEVEKYDEWHRRRLEVAPGITGLWQVSGRSNLTFDEMVMLDLYYAENWSLGLDMKILLRTIPTVLLGEGAY
ncbi:MAG: undecaprenyl-phosphate glucose phosphotransferase [Anaerolineae bacterium]|nr:undecaprenyl-phosphate glucose phosphotransferase [Anaerolineae bacterium]